MIDAASDVDDAIDTHRMEAFSDGVRAVIITIMAFDLRTPVAADVHGLWSRLPSLRVYILSFTFIGIYWNNHHHLLRATRQISAALMSTNLHLLFWLSLIPFATSWVSTQYAHTTPAVTYGVVALGAALAHFALVPAILRANPDDDALNSAVGRDVGGHLPAHLPARRRPRVRDAVPQLRLLRGDLARMVHPRAKIDATRREEQCEVRVLSVLGLIDDAPVAT